MAIKQLVKALKKAPSFADAYYLRAKLYEAKGGLRKNSFNTILLKYTL